MKSTQQLKLLAAGKSAVAISMIGLFGACAPMSTSLQTGALVKKSTEPVVEKADELACLTDAVDYEITTQITSFEMTGSFGATFGFNNLGPLKAIGLDANYSKGSLTTSMQLWDPLKPGVSLANKSGKGIKNSFSFGLNFLQGILGVGFNFFTQTSAYDLSDKSLKDNLTNLVTGMNVAEKEWETNIINIVNDQSFEIPVGYRAGLARGDEFDVFMTSYDWSGMPCASNLRMSRKADHAMAKAYVKDLSADTAYLEVKGEAFGKLALHMAVIPALPGADSKGVVGAAKNYAKSIRISNVSQAQPIIMQAKDGTTKAVDFSAFVKLQLRPLVELPTYGGFWLRE